MVSSQGLRFHHGQLGALALLKIWGLPGMGPPALHPKRSVPRPPPPRNPTSILPGCSQRLSIFPKVIGQEVAELDSGSFALCSLHHP